MGLSSIKGFGDAAISVILEKQPFNNLDDFVLKINKTKVNKGSLEKLVLAGACDLWLEDKENRLGLLKRIYDLNKNKHEITDSDVELFSKKELLFKEKELLGTYFSGHPLDDIAKPITWSELLPREKVTSYCILSSLREIQTKKGYAMAFVDLSYIEQDTPAILFPDIYNQEIVFRKEETTIGKVIKVGMILKVRGFMNYNPIKEDYDFIVDKIQIPVNKNKHLLEDN